MGVSAQGHRYAQGLCEYRNVLPLDQVAVMMQQAHR